jgi:hypothetical protein
LHGLFCLVSFLLCTCRQESKVPVLVFLCRDFGPSLPEGASVYGYIQFLATCAGMPSWVRLLSVSLAPTLQRATHHGLEHQGGCCYTHLLLGDGEEQVLCRGRKATISPISVILLAPLGPSTLLCHPANTILPPRSL